MDALLVIPRRGLVAGTLASAFPFAANAAQGKMVFNRGTASDPDSLDPHVTGGNSAASIVYDLYLGLMTVDGKGEVVHGAAESHTVSADGLTWTFKLRPNLRWSDGRPLPAEDWVWSFRRMLDPKTAYPLASRLFPIRNARAVATGQMPVTALGVSAVDARTLKIELENPTPYFTDIIMSAAMPAPRHGLAGGVLGNKFHLVSGSLQSGTNVPGIVTNTDRHDVLMFDAK